MQKYLLIQTLPSSGSDWFAGAIADAAPELHYHREFFQPMHNMRFERELSLAFGVENPTLAHNIAVGGPDELLERIYSDTWMQTEARMTKEVWSPAKTLWFKQHFHVIALMRSFEDTFPPRRNRVYAWYDAIFHAARCAGEISERPDSVMARCRLAWLWAWGKILSAGVPVVNYHTLVGGKPSVIHDELVAAGLNEYVDVRRVVENLMATRSSACMERPS